MEEDYEHIYIKRFATEEINQILDEAEEFKNGKKLISKDKSSCKLIFEPSTRTHYSFDKAAYNLGLSNSKFWSSKFKRSKGETFIWYG